MQWKEGMDLAAKFAQRNAAAQETAKGRKRAHQQQMKTFFTWFCDNGDPSDDKIAEVIKDDMWPNPLQYFLVPDIEVENGEDEDDDAEINFTGKKSQSPHQITINLNAKLRHNFFFLKKKFCTFVAHTKIFSSKHFSNCRR